ncbi:hypothetical protein AGABI2DRAFT_191416 [Agaricus bisporus var. bisporus H97]|uniref:hypothetical protein n=1 Tax=Agaricus bisporus var. bisporus (strain H97 / ATCC MYA-4626 / FGSC 10389) TaxID=936046 RepID=UPI00029F534D|nr:hypothetical protein AGABI2DRAFT_191416 [Agaricus bisporus var. bisporus H97]EKV49363.1 hypothetical protein AGABI2DRAFT_191416 [Agaricus bisporus var. bisporus H97]
MPSHHTVVVLYDVIALTAMVMFICSFLPAIFSRGVQRSAGWYSLMTAWLVYALSYILLVGKQEGPEPAFGLCMLQTLLVYAAPSLASTSMVCYCIEFYLIIYGIRSGLPRQPRTLLSLVLVIIPWLVFLAIVIEGLLLIFLAKNPVQRAKNGFYCHLENNIPETVTAAIVLINGAILLPLEVWTGVIMYQNWDIFKRLDRADRQLVLTVYLRLLVCTLAALLALVFSMLAFVFPEADATSIVYPTIPFFLAFAFGTQKDVLRAWMFWKSPEPYSSILYASCHMMTTNVYTSGDTVVDVSTDSEMQSIEQKRPSLANSMGQALSPTMSPRTKQDGSQAMSSRGTIHVRLPTDETVANLTTES